jgi:alkanesulfonate monooxygenase SsuD/methylene tetrahydromethanopterin reductase-like flavin-dependent oxidoreductase (luciferase family)
LKTCATASYAPAWRHPAAPLTDIWDPERYEHLARTLEAARFDAAFFADGLGVSDLYRNSCADYLGRGGQTSLLDPMTVLPLMARVTTHLGIGRTLSTTFHEPYHLACSLGSLDLVSKGRVAWNVVTSSTNCEALNFSDKAIAPKDERYDRGDEVLETCFALWDCWDEDAVVLDRARRVHRHRQGPARQLPRPFRADVRTNEHPALPAGPAGDHAGRILPARTQFSARWAELIFCSQATKEDAREFRDDMRARLNAIGRDPDGCAVLPSVTVVIGETESIARICLRSGDGVSVRRRGSRWGCAACWSLPGSTRYGNRIYTGPVPGSTGSTVNFGLTAAEALDAGKIDGFGANGIATELAVTTGVGAIVLDVRRGDGPPAAVRALDRDPERSETRRVARHRSSAFRQRGWADRRDRAPRPALLRRLDRRGLDRRDQCLRARRKCARGRRALRPDRRNAVPPSLVITEPVKRRGRR